MKILESAALAALALGFCSVAAADSIIESWSCEFKDDATIEDVQAVNSKWLKWINDNVDGGEITSGVGTAIVGDTTRFIFVDTYPDLATWAAAKDALDSDAADELDDMFEDVSECSENRLWKMQSTK